MDRGRHVGAVWLIMPAPRTGDDGNDPGIGCRVTLDEKHETIQVELLGCTADIALALLCRARDALVERVLDEALIAPVKRAPLDAKK